MKPGDIVKINTAVAQEESVVLRVDGDSALLAKYSVKPSSSSCHIGDRFVCVDQLLTLPLNSLTIVSSLKSDQMNMVIRRFASLATSMHYEMFHKDKTFIAGKTKVNYAGRVYNEKEMIALVDSALDYWLTAGPNAAKLEESLRDYFDAARCCLVNSGSSANLLAIGALCSSKIDGHLCPGDEVITPAVTFPTTLTPILQYGLVPVFVDCQIDTYNIDPELIESALSPATRAIFVPHTLGNPCAMENILSIADRHKLFLIEDSCDALGAVYNGKLVGTFGQLATLSFYPAHHMTMGEGGAVIVNDGRFERLVMSLRDWGRDCWCEPGHNDTCGNRFAGQWGKLPYGYDHKYVYSSLGYNLKITDMQAAIGLEQFKKLAGFIDARRNNFSIYYESLKDLDSDLILPRWEKQSEPSWFGFPLAVRDRNAASRIVRHLERANIETRKVFAGNILLQPGFLEIPHRLGSSMERTSLIMENAFFFGVYPGLTPEMRDHVVRTIRSFFGKT